MEFWGVEVKPGQHLGCSPGEDKYVHLSQVAIGEGSKSDERVAVYIHVDGKKIMIGSCLRGSCDQFGLDLVFEKDFKISHTSKSASVFCCGYTTFIQEEDEFGSLNGEDEDDDESESEDEKVPQLVITAKENGGKQPVKAEKVEKSESGSVAMPGKSNKEGMKVKPETPKQPAKVEEDDDSDGDESDDDEDEDMEDLSGSEDDDEEDDDEEDEDDEDESDEETPKAPAGKKRPVPDSAAKTPVSDKKAKFATPEGHKTGDNKKNVHVATPHPGAKQGGKKGKETPGGPKQQTPASKETPKSNASTPASGKNLAANHARGPSFQRLH